MKGNTKRLTVDLVVEAAAYSSGDLLADKIEIPGAAPHDGGVLVIHNSIVIDRGKQSAAMEFLCFKSDPSATTFTKNSALTLGAADVAKMIGSFKVAATDYLALANESIATIGESDADSHLPLVLQLDGTAKLFLAALSGGTPTYTAAGNLTLILEVEQLTALFK